MIVADEPLLKTWSPPPEPDISPTPPVWTRLSIGDAELSNSLEELSWHKGIIYPVACEGCYSPICAAVGMARVVRLGRDVLWLKPAERFVGSEWWHEVFDGSWPDRLTPADVLFSCSVWNSLSCRFPSIRSADELSPATNADLVQLWFNQTPAALRGDEARVRRDAPDWIVEAIRYDALAADPVDLIPASGRIGRLLTDLLSAPDEPATGWLMSIAEAAGTVESIYFDGEPFVEWPAAVFDPDSLVIDGRWAWVREPG